jgi:hypothetical protein
VNSDHDNADAEPKLPPSPLTEVVEVPPDVPLPWSAVPLGALVGLITGVGYGVVVTAAVGGPHFQVWIAAYEGGVDAAGALLIVFGAVLLDRLVPTWPRAVRWASGMGAAALAGVGLMVGVGYVLSGLGAGLPTWDVLGVLAGTGVSYALLGGALALAGGSGRDLLWRLPLAGSTAMAAVVVLRLGSSHLLGVPLLIVGPAGSMVGPVLGLLLGLVMAERLNAAQRRAVEQDSPWTQE